MRTMIWLGISWMGAAVIAAAPLGTNFTYQGRLTMNGVPASGVFDLRFRLLDAVSGGATIGALQCHNNVSVTNGLFTMDLDFGAQFAGEMRFLEIEVRADAGQNCNNAAGFTVLGPRQELTPAPNASFAGNAAMLGGQSEAFYRNASNLSSGTVSAGLLPNPLTISGDNATHIIRGENANGSTGAAGVYGISTATTGTTAGIFGRSGSDAGRGVAGLANSLSGTTTGVFGQTLSPLGRGVFGESLNLTGAGFGGRFESLSIAGTGVMGVTPAVVGTTFGVVGQSASVAGRGVFGEATAATGTNFGGRFESASTSGRGAFGVATANTGSTYGVFGRVNSPDGVGVYGETTAAELGNQTGVYGRTTGSGGTGVFGEATSTDNVSTVGVRGTANGSGGRGVWGSSTNGDGGYFTTDSDGYGVWGRALSTTGSGVGVRGETESSDSNSYGVVGAEPTGSAGHAIFAFGTIGASGTKSFRIDHPLDPENAYLLHYCAEGPEPMNAYSGNEVTDDRGEVWVTLPAYFESINRNFRYQLTVVDSGEDFVLAKVAREIESNRFLIRTSQPRTKVSWRVEATRNDLWTKAHGFRAEQTKEDNRKGKYLHPELYGKPAEQGLLRDTKSIDQRDNDLRKRLSARAAENQAEAGQPSPPPQ